MITQTTKCYCIYHTILYLKCFLPRLLFITIREAIFKHYDQHLKVNYLLSDRSYEHHQLLLILPFVIIKDFRSVKFYTRDYSGMRILALVTAMFQIIQPVLEDLKVSYFECKLKMLVFLMDLNRYSSHHF